MGNHSNRLADPLKFTFKFSDNVEIVIKFPNDETKGGFEGRLSLIQTAYNRLIATEFTLLSSFVGSFKYKIEAFYGRLILSSYIKRGNRILEVVSLVYAFNESHIKWLKLEDSAFMVEDAEGSCKFSIDHKTEDVISEFRTTTKFHEIINGAKFFFGTLPFDMNTVKVLSTDLDLETEFSFYATFVLADHAYTLEFY